MTGLTGNVRPRPQTPDSNELWLPGRTATVKGSIEVDLNSAGSTLFQTKVPLANPGATLVQLAIRI